MTNTEREVALDVLSDFVSDVDHDTWRGRHARRRLDRALALVEDGPAMKAHESKLVAAVHVQKGADDTQYAWERLGGAKP